MLVCMGREVSFDLVGGRKLDAPTRAGLLYDASGADWPRCSLLVARFRQGSRPSDDAEGRNYFGRGADVRCGSVDLPPSNGWRDVGEVHAIYYRRAGTKAPGYYRHRFGRPRGLVRIVFAAKKSARGPAKLQRMGNLYRIDLPRGCVIDDRGIVVP